MKDHVTFDGYVVFVGTPGAIRTHGLQSRSLTLYPTELRAHDAVPDCEKSVAQNRMTVNGYIRCAVL